MLGPLGGLVGPLEIENDGSVGQLTVWLLKSLSSGAEADCQPEVFECHAENGVHMMLIS